MNNALHEPQTILLLGGSSDIGRAIVAELISPTTTQIILAGREPSKLAPEVLNTEVPVATETFDADDVAAHQPFAEHIAAAYGDIDVVIAAFGVLSKGDEVDNDPVAAAAIAHTNYTGAVSSLTAFASVLRDQGHGQLVVITSVAGERGRASNYVYGSTKAGLDTFAQGLGDALAGTGVKVLVVRPGFVVSKMTEGLEPQPLATTPQEVAKITVQGIRSGAHTVWAPRPMRYIFSALRHLPRGVFRRLNL